MALVPEDQTQEFPRWTYRPSLQGDETLIMNADQELHDALEQGWRTTPSPEPPGYPQNWVGVGPSRGSDYRRVLVRKPKQEKLFKESTDPAKWTRDDTYSLAGRSIGLDELAAEHHQRMRAALEEESRHPTVSDADDHAGKAHEHESEGSGAESQSIRFIQGRAEYSIY